MYCSDQTIPAGGLGRYLLLTIRRCGGTECYALRAPEAPEKLRYTVIYRPVLASLEGTSRRRRRRARPLRVTEGEYRRFGGLRYALRAGMV